LGSSTWNTLGVRYMEYPWGQVDGIPVGSGTWNTLGVR
jgi:hypothetical protein